jgi:hypothetical protein
MWIKNFINECKVWNEIRKVYKKNKDEFLKKGLKMDWFGHIYTVINRDVNIPIGTLEDEILLRKELNDIQEFLVKHNIVDILAYELKPQEETYVNENGEEIYENAYLVLFTPAYRLDKQYLTIKNVILLIFFFCLIVGGIISLFLWI